jgi:hypothetical protein
MRRQKQTCQRQPRLAAEDRGGRLALHQVVAAGAQVSPVGGCCGLAGNFGVERGHYDVSTAIAETALLPAVRAAGQDATVLAGGFSCRTQLDQLADVKGTLPGRAARLPATGRAADQQRQWAVVHPLVCLLAHAVPLLLITARNSQPPSLRRRSCGVCAGFRRAIPHDNPVRQIAARSPLGRQRLCRLRPRFRCRTRHSNSVALITARSRNFRGYLVTPGTRTTARTG